MYQFVRHSMDYIFLIVVVLDFVFVRNVISTNCLDARDEALSNTKLKNSTGIPGMVGKFVPKCKEDGSWEEIQCSTETGFCWCVLTSTGENIMGSIIRFDRPGNCTSTCVMKRHSGIFLEARYYLHPFIPSCENNGQFKKKQCDMKKKICYCVQDVDLGTPNRSTIIIFGKNEEFLNLEC